MGFTFLLRRWLSDTPGGAERDRVGGYYSEGKKQGQKEHVAWEKEQGRGHVNPSQSPVPWRSHLLSTPTPTPTPRLVSAAITFPRAEIEPCLETGWS